MSTTGWLRVDTAALVCPVLSSDGWHAASSRHSISHACRFTALEILASCIPMIRFVRPIRFRMILIIRLSSVAAGGSNVLDRVSTRARPSVSWARPRIAAFSARKTGRRSWHMKCSGPLRSHVAKYLSSRYVVGLGLTLFSLGCSGTDDQAANPGESELGTQQDAIMCEPDGHGHCVPE